MSRKRSRGGSGGETAACRVSTCRSKEKARADRSGTFLRENLEAESHAAADAAGGLDQIDCLAVLANHRNVALRHQVADIDECFHLRGNEVSLWNRLPNEDIEVRLGLAGGCVELIDRRERLPIRPFIRSHPLRL